MNLTENTTKAKLSALLKIACVFCLLLAMLAISFGNPKVEGEEYNDDYGDYDDYEEESKIPSVFPSLPENPGELLALLGDDRLDIRTAAKNKLLKLPFLSPALFNEKLKAAPMRERILLYAIAGVWGDSESLTIMLKQYDPHEPYKYVSLRLMENILILGQKIPTPVEYLPYLLNAWLEGNEYISEEAKYALLNMGSGVNPQLKRILRSSDSSLVYSALELMIDKGDCPAPQVREIALQGAENACEALDVLMSCTNGGAATAVEILTSETVGWLTKRRALWWLVCSNKVPTYEVLETLTHEGKAFFGAEARKVIMLSYPQKWLEEENKYRFGEKKIDERTANLLVACADRESLQTLVMGICTKKAEQYRANYFDKFLKLDLGESYKVFEHIRQHFTDPKAHGAQRLTDLSYILVRSGKFLEAAKVLSRSLHWQWDNATVTTLIELLSEFPELDKNLFLSCYDEWSSIDPMKITRTQKQLAAILKGDLEEYNAIVNHPQWGSVYRRKYSGLLNRFVF